MSGPYKQLDQTGWRPTHLLRRRGDIVQGKNGSVWLYKAVPMGPMADATSPEKIREAAAVLETAVEELSRFSTSRTGRRNLDRSGYREVHILHTNIDWWWKPPATHPNRVYLAAEYPAMSTERRVLLLGVQLSAGAATWRENIASFAYAMVAQGVPPLSDFAVDAEHVDMALSRCGLRTVTDEEWRQVNAWWARGGNPGVYTLPHGDHIHLLRTGTAARAVESLIASEPDCVSWPDIPDAWTMSASTVERFDLGYIDATSDMARWVTALVDQGALAVSIRGLIEPAKTTRSELRRHKRNYIDDIRQRQESNQMSRAEQDETLDQLNDVERFYATGGPTALVDASVTVALSGRDPRLGYDPREIGEAAGLALVPMEYRQDAALEDMMVASSVRANPYQHDITSTMLAYSGLPSLSTVGDSKGALLGFTQRDSQPAWLDPMAAVDADSIPGLLLVGQSGSGKTVLLQWLADQLARIPNSRGELSPVILIDLKQGSDCRPVVARSGGVTYSLDDLMKADGVFDAVRFSISQADGIEMAHSLLMQVNPWGSRAVDYDAPLMNALAYGVRAGATCTGQALLIAKRDNPAMGPMVQAVEDLASASPMFRAVCGFNPQSVGLRAASGLTYIRIGDGSLNLPAPGSPGDSVSQRTTLALVKAMVYGSMSALNGREGTVMFDEGWIFLQSGRDEMDRMARLARSMKILPVIATQRVREVLAAGLKGSMSRGIILPMEDREEAAAALEVFRLEGTADRYLDRITAKAALGNSGAFGTEGAGPGAPNWASFRALRSPTGETLRGTIGIYCDMSGRAVPTEIRLSPSFLHLAVPGSEPPPSPVSATVPAPPAMVVPAGLDDGWG